MSSLQFWVKLFCLQPCKLHFAFGQTLLGLRNRMLRTTDALINRQLEPVIIAFAFERTIAFGIASLATQNAGGANAPINAFAAHLALTVIAKRSLNVARRTARRQAPTKHIPHRSLLALMPTIV
jgi:hypothetical protein